MRSWSSHRMGLFILVSMAVHVGLGLVLPGAFSLAGAPPQRGQADLRGFLTGAPRGLPALAEDSARVVAEPEPSADVDASSVTGATTHAVQIPPVSGGGRNGVYYWPVADVERVAVPVSSPDLDHLATQTVPSGRIRLRLFISARGQVDAVQVLGAEDEGIWAAVRDMFLATGFLPARRGGHDVASVQDLDIEISDLIRSAS